MPYVTCPEQSRRRRAQPSMGMSSIEQAYRTRLRKVLVRYYSALMDGRHIEEEELRRNWGSLWPKDNAPPTPSLRATEQEKALYRGAVVIHKVVTRRLGDMRPVAVNEPWVLDLGEVSIGGTFDLVWEYGKQGQYWIVDWSKTPIHYTPRYDLAHTAMIAAWKNLFNKPASVVLDYVLSSGEIQYSPRASKLYDSQLQEIQRVARCISREDYYRRVGSACTPCPYRAKCLGELLEPHAKKSGTSKRSGLRTEKGK